MSHPIIRFYRVILPQVILVILYSIHLYTSAHIFRYLDGHLANQTFYDIIIFEFATLATIGYGNIAPRNDKSRVFCILFAIIGIPISILMLANFGKHLGKAFWLALSYIKMPKASINMYKDVNMPLPFIIFLFIITFVFGTSHIPHTGKETLADHCYFGFISFSTVGFGDKYPSTTNFSEMFIILIFLTWGMILTTTLFSHLSKYFQKVYYFGRRFTGARDVPIWIDGKCMRVSDLIAIVATEFHASPHTIHEILEDLDDILEIDRRQDVEAKIPLIGELEDYDCFD
ncbi:unnamed protein product [Auanema sp. JU1783]|nr:unnamed protein product [Auanema sp. JU1783]